VVVTTWEITVKLFIALLLASQFLLADFLIVRAVTTEHHNWQDAPLVRQ